MSGGTPEQALFAVAYKATHIRPMNGCRRSSFPLSASRASGVGLGRRDSTFRHSTNANTISRGKKTNKKTFEQFLTENVLVGHVDFKLRAEMEDEYTVRFYIHCDGHDSDTLDFLVDENELIPFDDRA